MYFLKSAFHISQAAVLAFGLLTGCKSAEVAPVPTPAPPKPTQYGTPFAGVPNREDAVIYQVNMRAFSQGGNLAGVTARLDSIKALGANVVYLMPIYPIGAVKAVNSPYAVKDYMAVNPEFGTLTDLRALVDGAHSRGLSVMLDWVANHTSWDNAWITQHPEWYSRNAAGAIQSPPNTNYTDVAQLDFTSVPMRLAMIDAMKSWVYTANVDGFRFDYADAPPIGFWKQAVDSLRNIKTHKLLLMAEGARNANFSAGFDYNFGSEFYGGFWDVYRRSKPATTLNGLNSKEYATAEGTQQVVRFTTNHDVNGSDGTPVYLFGGEDGAMSAFVIASLYKGVPMIYNGQEAGMTTAIPFPFTSVKINWGANPAVTKAYKQLLAVRASSPTLQHGTTTDYNTPDVCAFTRTAGTEQVLVLVNVRGNATQYNVPQALSNITWTDVLQGGSVTLGNRMTLPAYGYRVLKK